MLRSSRRLFSSLSLIRAQQPPTTAPQVPLDNNHTDIPGFRQPGEIASNYELAMGKERYEHLQRLQGVENPWVTTGPIVVTAKGTVENPIVVKGIDPVYYVGCSGYPSGSHEMIYLTLKGNKKTVDRCPHCGQAFKYEQDHLDHHH